jgi:hypothetical protein
MKLAFRDKPEIITGLLFMVVGIAFVWFAKDLKFGTTYRIGPAYFPLVLATMLTIVGLLVTIRGLLSGEEGEVQGIGWRGLVFVIGAVVFFAVFVQFAGVALAIFATALIGAIGSREFRLAPNLLIAGGLAIFTVVVFIYLLHLPLPALPRLA